MRSRKKLTKSPKLSTQNQLQGTELPLVLESAAKSKNPANRQRITPLTEWVVRVYGAEKGATEGGKSPSTGESLIVSLMRSEISYLRLEKKVLVPLGKEASGVCREVGFTGTQSFSVCAHYVHRASRRIRGAFQKTKLSFCFQKHRYASHHWVSFPCDIHWVYTLWIPVGYHHRKKKRKKNLTSCNNTSQLFNLFYTLEEFIAHLLPP